MDAPQVKLPVGSKYALLTLPLYRAGHLQSADLGDGYLAVAQLPVVVPEHWQTWVGTLQYEDIVGAAFYLIVHAKGRDLKTLDEENRLLRTKVYYFYTGFTLAVPYVSHEQLIFLSGASLEEETDVREFTTYPAAFFIEGSKPSEVSLTRLMAAKRIGINIGVLAEKRSVENLGRMLTAFRTAHQAEELDTRLHQFVRVVEGFVVPETSKKAAGFAERIEQLVSGIDVRDLRHIYAIRGTIEHLRGPTIGITGTARERHATLMLRAIQAETLARYFLGTFLDSPDLWSHFADARSTQAFWKLPLQEKRELWKGGTNLDNVAKSFQVPEHIWQQMGIGE